MTMLLHELLSRSAARSPDAVAVVEPGRQATYGELELRSTALAGELVERSVSAGERVVIALQNSVDFVVAYFGVLKAGAVAVPLPPGPRSDRLPKVAHDCEPAAYIVDESTWPVTQSAGGRAAARFVVARNSSAPVLPGSLSLHALAADVSALSATREAATVTSRVEADALAAIIYTSGSTGMPRGVMLSHGNIIANTESIVGYLNLSAADRVMVVLPFYYVYGLSLLHTHVAVGGTLVIDNRFAFPNAVLRSMREHAVTGFAGVPSTFALLLHRSNIGATPLPSLRYVTQAGGAMPPARIQEWLRAVPGVPFYVMYGATEASARLTYLPPEELRRRPGSIGRAIPGVDVRVLRDDGEVAAAGETGELVARGPNISRGYWNSPDATRERFGADGYRTGDLGYADEDGFLYLVARRSEMLKIGAHRVSPREIEDALHEHPAVHEVAVVGIADDLLGEAAAAYVVAREGHSLTEQDMLLFARGRLPEHKVPARVMMLAELPKTPAGKVNKRALHEAACAVTP